MFTNIEQLNNGPAVLPLNNDKREKLLVNFFELPH